MGVVVFGSINVDLVTRVTSIARPGETVLAPRYEQSFGGKGANQAVAAARAATTREAVRMAGMVGHDALGEAAVANLKVEAIATQETGRSQEPTGCAFISVDAAGENAITVASGANQSVLADQLGPLGAADVLVTQMEVPFTQTVRALERAGEAGARTVCNFAPADETLRAGEVARLLAATQILVVNEHELETVARILGLYAEGSDGEPRALALRVAGRAGCSVVATLGARGAILAGPDGAATPFAAPRIEPVDTTGAGDTLVGVLAAGLCDGMHTEAALERAIRAASLACLARGAQSGIPKASDIDAAV